MNKSTVVAYLRKNQDPRGIEHWKKRNRGALKSYGIGLTILRKYAKSIGRDAKLAKSLWNSNIHEMKIISILIDDPKTMTVEQAETQVDELEGGYLVHVFSACDAPLAKTPFVVELADKWIKSKDTIRRRCGYGLLYEISKNKKKSAPDEAYFLAHVEDIDKKRKKASIPILSGRFPRRRCNAPSQGAQANSRATLILRLATCHSHLPLENSREKSLPYGLMVYYFSYRRRPAEV